MLPLLLLRADAQVLRNALRFVVPEKDLGPVIDRLLANASSPDSLAELRSDLEARGEVFGTVLALQANGAHRPADRDPGAADGPAGPAEGARGAATADGGLTQERTARVVAELHRRATVEGWHTPFEGERGIVLRWPGDVAPTDVEDWLGGAPNPQEAERLRETIRGGAAFDWTWGAASLVMAADQTLAGEQDFLGRVWEFARVLALSALAAHAFRAVRAVQRVVGHREARLSVEGFQAPRSAPGWCSSRLGRRIASARVRRLPFDSRAHLAVARGSYPRTPRAPWARRTAARPASLRSSPSEG